jgi:hypothetical protein
MGAQSPKERDRDHGSYYVRPPFLEQTAPRGGNEGGAEALTVQAGQGGPRYALRTGSCRLRFEWRPELAQVVARSV